MASATGSCNRPTPITTDMAMAHSPLALGVANMRQFGPADADATGRWNALISYCLKTAPWAASAITTPRRSRDYLSATTGIREGLPPFFRRFQMTTTPSFALHGSRLVGPLDLSTYVRRETRPCFVRTSAAILHNSLGIHAAAARRQPTMLVRHIAAGQQKTAIGVSRSW